MNTRFTRCAVAATVLSLSLAACSSSGKEDSSGGTYETEASASADPATSPAVEADPALDLSIVNRTNVKLDQALSLTVQDGELASATVKGVRQGAMGQTEDKRVKLPGTVADKVWTASAYMEPSTRYTVTATLVDGSKLKDSFTTQTVPLARQTYPTLYPSSGMFGIAQPVVIRFDVPVSDKAAFEEKLSVTTVPKQAGAWRWISDNEVRYRPKTYWKPNTKINVKAAVNSVPAGNGVYGQFDSAGSFTIGKVARRAEVNLDTQTMKVFLNDKVIRTIPVSTGKTYSDSGFITRTGTKIVMGHERTHRMRSSTLGIADGSPESYDLVVDYAMRLTNTGEFFHAAPWNSSNFGVQGASHGCTGLSMADAIWIYNFFDEGDPIKYVSKANAGYPDRPMTIDNGFGDWNMSFAEYKN